MVIKIHTSNLEREKARLRFVELSAVDVAGSRPATRVVVSRQEPVLSHYVSGLTTCSPVCPLPLLLAPPVLRPPFQRDLGCIDNQQRGTSAGEELTYDI
jgi:hypothetical protein